MKIVGILGSPHKTGGSAQLLHVALKGAEREGAQTEFYSVYDGEIKPCIGCIHDEDPYCKFPCIFDDYGKFLLQKMYEADGIIFATPIYWYAPSGALKNLIDRMTSMENMVAYKEPSYLEGKVFGAISVGADAGGAWSGGYLVSVMTSMGCIIPPWGIAYSHKRENAIFDDKALLDAMNIGILTARLIARINGTNVPLTFVEDRDLAYKIRDKVLEELKKYQETQNIIR